MRCLVITAFAAAGLAGCSGSRPPDVPAQAQRICPTVAPPVAWAGPPPDLSAPITLEYEVRLPAGGPATDLERYFRPLGFGVELRELPGTPPIVAVIAKKTGQFSLNAIESIGAGAASQSTCSFGSSVSIRPVTGGS